MAAEIDVEIAAKMLGVSGQTIHRYIRKKLLLGRQERGGAHVHISRQSVVDLLARMSAQVNAPPRKS